MTYQWGNAPIKWKEFAKLFSVGTRSLKYIANDFSSSAVPSTSCRFHRCGQCPALWKSKSPKWFLRRFVFGSENIIIFDVKLMILLFLVEEILNRREQSLENRRPIILRRREEVYRPFPVVQPLFIQHPVYYHKRRPQFDSEEWSSDSSEARPKRKKNNKKKNHYHIKEQSDEEHHFHYLPILPKLRPINYPNCTDLHPNNVTLVSRLAETIIEVKLGIQYVINQAQSG